ncbi:hypothetical protein DFH09DRAFT_1357415 [Mycena vulgaris]|nr:hypothetical protein DFH09DRAFT_1357415 [Mycena vulgaris]
MPTMRLFQVYLPFSICLAPAILALSPAIIIESLNGLTTQANQTTLLLNEVVAREGDLGANVVASKSLLDETTAAYLAFSDRVANDHSGVVLDQLVSSQMVQAADLHSKMFSTMGIALARSLPAYNEYGYYDAGCADGVDIGLSALALFVHLSLKFPRKEVVLLLDGLATNLRVPLAQLSAAGCFVPILGPLR